MNGELTALALSGATTLVSLMATESWTQARDLVARFLSRNDGDRSTLVDLDLSRTQLLSAHTVRGRETADALIGRWAIRLQGTLGTSAAPHGELRSLLDALQRLAGEEATPESHVHNEVNGGVHHAPVIQAGRISGLTFHTPPTGPGPLPPG